MIAKILKSSALFKAVKYNTGKVDKQKGELLKVSGFGPLQGMTKVRPEDYINYLKMVSAQNKRVRKPQFHAAISEKGRSATKEELLDIATNWMNKMGYGDQPYLVIFHKDTDNNHVHVVSSRVGMDGKKVNSNFERIRSLQAMNQIMDQDEVRKASADLRLALGFHFQTKAQFKLILEQKGYAVSEVKQQMQLIKGGVVLHSVSSSEITDRIAVSAVNIARARQLAQILLKYKSRHSSALRLDSTARPSGLVKTGVSYTSDLAEHLKTKMGIVLVFHGKQDKTLPYGYSVLDLAGGNVFKGSEVMPMQKLLAAGLPEPDSALQRSSAEEKINALSSFTPVPEVTDPARVQVDELEMDFPLSGPAEHFDPPVQISISDDIDDEAIHGRNRHRKRQARTNTR